MIGMTYIKTQGLFRDRRRLGIGDLKSPSSFGGIVTWVVGSKPTSLEYDVVKEPDPKTPAAVALPTVEHIDPGSQLRFGRHLGPFRLLEKLGRGAQGDVWKARRLEVPGGDVALKVLNPVFGKTPSRRAQFRREAERGARLVGPGLLNVFEYGEAEGFAFMAMPFVEGTTLQEVIRGRCLLLAGEEAQSRHALVAMAEADYLPLVVRIVSKAAIGLAQLHENQVAHRDVKPSNILLDDHQPPGVYLCDLGLGRDLNVATTEQMRDGAGTPLYMAPERLMKAPADEVRGDLYSLGVTLYEALTLKRPFRIPDGMPIGLLRAHLARAEPIELRIANPRLPEDLEMIVMRTMARDPRGRYDSARELAGVLDQFAIRWGFSIPRQAVNSRELLLAGPHRPIEPRQLLALAQDSP